MSFRRSIVFGALCALAVAGCGDVKSELITGATGGAAGSPGGASTGGTSSSGAGGANAGGTNAGSSSGGASAGNAGSSTGGTNGGSGGTPECTPETAETDCTGSDRVYCHPGSHTCVECVYDAHCSGDEDCSEALGECAVTCESTADCTDDEDRFCDTTIGGFCVECLNNSDCPSGQCSNWSCD